METNHPNHDDPVVFMYSCDECKAMIDRYMERELNERKKAI